MSQSKYFKNKIKLSNNLSTKSITKVKSENTEVLDQSKTQSRTKRVRKLQHIKLETTDDGDNDSIIPDNFFPMYNKIKEMRKLITTPVDLIGCVKIPALLFLITKRFQNGISDEISIDQIPNYFEELKLIENNKSNIDKFWRFQLLVTLLFSSQTKDEINYQVMQNLHLNYLIKGYKNGLSIESILNTSYNELDQMIFKIGFHSRKANYLIETSKILHENFNDDIPNNINDLINLKGIGYKMGHLILQGAWNETVGISVDTHMVRLCNMFNWLPKNEKNPDNVRKLLEIMLINHKDLWMEINPVLVGFGQTVCTPIGRRCDICWLSKIDEFNDVKCPAIDKKLLLRINRGVENIENRKIRGDLQKLMTYRQSKSS